MNLFGFQITRVDDQQNKNNAVQTITSPEITDDIGIASIVSPSSFQGYNNAMDGKDKGIKPSENNLIRQYREIARNPEVDKAIEEIVSEAIIVDELQDSVKIDLGSTSLSDAMKDKVRDSFNKTMKLLSFRKKGFDIFRTWYIDGRLNYHVIIDEKDLSRGVVELRYINPTKIKKVRTLVKKQGTNSAKYIEYYEFNEQGVDNVDGQYTQGIRIAPDSIVHVNSGLTNPSGNIVIGYLDKAISPANKLRTLEHSMVIYRLVRAPERRIIYVDTGNLPKARAEQYLQSIVGKYKTKISYDTVSGKIKDDRNIMALTEDYFIPRQNGSKSTEFTTTPATGGSAGTVEEIEYLKTGLLDALNVPLGRMDKNSSISFGGGGMNTEVSREEARFAKFIQRLRVKFNILFTEVMERDLVLRRVLSIEEWEDLVDNVKFEYIKDDYYTELLASDALANKLGVLAQIEPFIGTFFSEEFVFTDILRLTDEQIINIKKQINAEKDADINAHVPTGNKHEIELQHKLASIEVDKASSIMANTPSPETQTSASDSNPFRK
jgi:hypothetical protein